MTLAFNIWLWVGVFVGLTWLVRHSIVSKIQRNRQSLSSHTYSDSPLPDAPHVTVVIAAKDEERHIETCVRSLLNQDHPNFDIIVANDRSTDRTADILANLQTEFPNKLTIVNIEHLPDNWYGKPHAITRAVKHATGEFLLFSDADCEFISPNAISTAVRYAEQENIGCLTLTPIVKSACLAESIIQPVCTAVLFLWHSPARVNNPATKTAYANGAFIMLHRDAYDRIGGHETVANTLVEDIAIARAVKNAGIHLRVMHNEDLYVTEMYDSLRAVRRGWSRIFQGSFGTPGRVFLGLFVLFLFSLLPWISAVVSTIGLASASPETTQTWQTLTLVWWITLILEQSVVWRFFPLMRAPAVRSLSYVVGVIATFVILCDAMLKLIGLGRTRWGDHRPNAMLQPQPTESPKPAAHAD